MSESVRVERLEGSRYNELNGDTKWPWGPIDAVHYVGDKMAVVEYRQDLVNFRPNAEQAVNHGRTVYQPFIKVEGHGWFDTCNYWPSLETAIVAAIAYRRVGEDESKAVGAMFDRMTLADRPADEHYEVELAAEKARNREQAAERAARKAAQA